jgi:fructuronate reductase
MTAPRLSRAISPDPARREPAAPVRIVHLGLGNFFRAHPCWYTQHAGDGQQWAAAAFTGRSSQPLVDALNAQDGLYTLVSRGHAADEFEVLGCVARAHHAADHQAWLRYFTSADLAAVTITITEAG